MIADEAERLANLLPVTSIKKLNGRSNISKDLFVCFSLSNNLTLIDLYFIDYNESTERF